MTTKFNTPDIPVGVVGLGLMGSSIAVAFLVAGHPVKAIAPVPTDLEELDSRIREHLNQCELTGLLKKPVDSFLKNLVITEDYSELAPCQLVLECVVEKIEVKEQVFQKITAVVSEDAIISSNTSAIPISLLQNYVSSPGRFLGIHWAEPAYVTRFLEITCGAQTLPERADWVFQLAHCWGKEPTLLRKDIRGFITNRLMYAVYREALHLTEKGKATPEAVDKAFRYDAGSWMTLMGVFRRMDYLGLNDFHAILKTYLPLLSNETGVPEIMQKMVENNDRGTQNGRGFYNYTPEEAKKWEDAFAEFNQEIFQLAAQYPASRLSNQL
jgi:3-hydroxybutyryl-CoA dehydrogenase